MARNIDVDIDELKRFLEVLKDFQEITSDKLSAVQSDWTRCNESWQGDAKNEFTKGFEQTEISIKSALDAGEDACQWLKDFHEILEEFEGYR
ncbi:WXG100 family type VII secretion target [Nostoc sp.]|uniref:WXG100 family type VII secretion target n=1 Tax=Nostoc sp. TaxID=1180 RepID=UPI002FFD1542